MVRHQKILYISGMPADVALNPQDHNYNKRFAAYVPKELLTPGVYIHGIAHDGWCGIYQQGNCLCKPEITIEQAITHKVVFALRWRA